MNLVRTHAIELDEPIWIERQAAVGVGIDLRDADRMFEPFQRKQTISNDRAALGLGGTGLGLTIVRMLADELHCRVVFTKPDERHATAVKIEWKELR